MTPEASRSSDSTAGSAGSPEAAAIRRRWKRLFFASGSSFSSANLVNNLIGGWAVVSSDTFASYINGQGVAQMGTTPGSTFDGTTIAVTTTASQNINDGTSRTLASNTVANSWRMAPGARFLGGHSSR